MKNSILLRRIVLLLLSSVMLAGLLTAGVYIFITQRTYVRMRADELVPIARAIAIMLTDERLDRYTAPSGLRLLERGNRDFLGAALHIYNSGGNSIMNPALPRVRVPLNDDDGLTQLIETELDIVLSGIEVSEIRKNAAGRSYLVVGVPAVGADGVVGAVIFTKPIDELSDAMRGMNLTLLASTFAAFLIMLAPAYFLVRRLVVPIRQMERVARAMSEGDYETRADETQKGEIGELARAMNHFAEESGRLEQTRRDYVANVSHELRTPIAAIRAMGETLRDGLARQEKQTLFYNNIVRESMRLSRLVDDLLELSRLQSGTEPFKKICFDLREVIQNIMDVYSHIAAEAGLSLLLDADMERAATVFSNPDRVEQLLVILLDNAIKHTPEGGLITLSLSEDAESVRLSVSDTGTGIPPEDLAHIFERFYKVDKSHSGEGTGLGLSIAHEVIKGLGETITAESGDGNTAFAFTLHKQALM